MSSAYWKDRFEALEAAGHKQAEETWAVIEQGFRDAQRQMESDIARWYQRVAKNNSVTVGEAKRMLQTKELKEFRWTVDEYIRKGQEMNLTGAWMKELENASARFHVTRLEALRLQLQNTVEVLYGGTLDALDSRLKEAYLDSYYHTAYEIQRGVGVGWDIAAINSRALQTVISNPWTTDGKAFSDRLWTQKAELISTLQKGLTSALMQGTPPDGVADLLAQKFGVSKYQAERLVYTEHAFFRSVAQGESYKALGVREYEFIATLDERTSDECREHDGNVYKMDDYAPGETAPPLHPWCRSTTAPHFSDMENVGERAARDQDTGKTYYVPRSMKYEEWKESLVKDDIEDDLRGVAKNGIMTAAMTSGGDGVHTAGKINREQYREIETDVTTDEVIITDERVTHCNRHNRAYDRYAALIPDILADPETILEDKLPHTAILLNKLPGNGNRYSYLVLRLHLPQDNPTYKNSIISFWDISESRKKNYENSRKVVYKKK